MSTSSKYDFIICGAGCAGLSLAMRMIASKKFSDKKVLLIDQDLQKSNDRTWCFWQNKQHLFEDIVYKRWNRMFFFGENFSSEFDIAPVEYKMIRAIDFYNHCLNEIRQHKNFEIVSAPVEAILTNGQPAIVVNGKDIYADYVFNSILFEKPRLANRDIWMHQHFKGWRIQTAQDVFDASVATLMDFRTNQRFGTAFCYLLPFNSREALVEYTLFSEKLISDSQYDEGLKSYINDILNISSYTITEKEFGIIPMTNYKFPKHENGVIHIGTAGGQTKSSSGYTYNFIQKHSEAIVDALISTGKPYIKEDSSRFDYYDSVLLQVLYDGKISGKEIFTDLFKKNSIHKVLKFLDNESSLVEEIKIISSLPMLPFVKAGIQQLV